MESDQFEFTVAVFHQRCAIFHPVATIHVEEVFDVADFRAVNMSANDAVDAMFAAALNQGALVVGNVFDGGFGFEFEVGSEGPVTEAQAPADFVEGGVEIEDAIVKGGADAVEQSVVLGQAIELVSVQDEISFAIGGGVDDAFNEFDGAEADAEEFFEEFVVVSG